MKKLSPEVMKSLESEAEAYQPTHDLEMCIEQADITGLVQSIHDAHLAGAISRAEKAQPLVEALKAWYDWEQEQIAKEGPYVGRRINELILQAEKALNTYLAGEGK